MLTSWIACSAVSATTFYVSPTGNDANAGTSTAAPWQTIAKVNSRNYSPGDAIYFQGGGSFPGKLQFNSASQGTPALHLVVGSYGTGRATILAGTGAGIYAENVGGLDIRDLNISSPDRLLNTESGIWIRNTLNGNVKLNYLRILRVDVWGFGKHGIFVEGKPSDNSKSGFTDVTIMSAVAHDNTYTGIYVEGTWDTVTALYAHSNVYIGSSTAYNNPGQPGYYIHSGDGILLTDTDGGMIEKCIAYNNGYLSNSHDGGPVGIWTAGANNVTIQFSESHHNSTSAVIPEGTFRDGGGFDLDGGTTNSTMQYNYSHDNGGPGYLVYTYDGSPHTFGNNVVRYNISQNDCVQAPSNADGAITAGVESVPMQGPTDIYNNTVYITKPPGKTVYGARLTANYIRFRNNIVFTNGGVPFIFGSTQTNSTIQGNNYWATNGSVGFIWGAQQTLYANLTAFRTATGMEKLGTVDTGFNVNPLLQAPGTGGTYNNPANLVNLTAYKLQATSPMIETALNLQTLFGINPGTRDYYATLFPQGPQLDIGANEYKPTNLIANPGFESALTSWLNWGNGAAVTGQSYAGTYSARVGTGTGGVAQNVISKVTAGKSYYLSARTKLGTANEPGSLGIKFLSSTGIVLFETYVPVTTTSYGLSAFSFVAPAGAAEADVYVWKDPGTSYVYADEVSLTVLP